MAETETATEHQSPADGLDPHLQVFRDLQAGHQAMAMDHINRDRCLLRRQMKAEQNNRYGLDQEEHEESCDDMGVQVGDNTVTHNHYEAPQQPSQPPCPPRKWPWWLIPLLVIPWIVLTTLLILWLIANRPDGGGGSDPRVIWRLDIGSTEPEPLPAVEPILESQE